MVSCGNSLSRNYKGLLIALKSSGSVEKRAIQPLSKDRCAKTRCRRAKRRLWPQGYNHKLEKTRKIPKAELQRIAKIMRDLAFSMDRSARVDECIPPDMKCSFNESTYNVTNLWSMVGFQEIVPPYKMDHGGLRWSQTPTSASNLGILKNIWRFDGRHIDHASLQIPSYWPVFDGISWKPRNEFALAPTDTTLSDEEPRSKSSESESDELDWGTGDEYREKYVRCQTKGLSKARLRSFWVFLLSINPLRFYWRRQTTARALRRDHKRHTGFLDMNQPSLNADIWPQKSIESLLGSREFLMGWGKGPSAELPHPFRLGRLFACIVATDAFPAQSCQLLRWPPLLAQAGVAPIIDYTCRARPDLTGWREDLCPLLFAVQHQYSDENHAIQRLAEAFQPMMKLFILCYLDCRKSLDEPMPCWMVLFGVLYDEDGLTVRAHFPRFDSPDATFGQSKEWGWSSVSCVATSDYGRMIHFETFKRGACLGTLNRIQGHCVYVLQRLQNWDGYERACSELLLD